MQMKNADAYVTESNSRMLSSDILTQFRDRDDEIRVYPFSFAEYYLKALFICSRNLPAIGVKV